MKKSLSQKKKLHIHFDEKDDLLTSEGENLSLAEQLIKRQNKLLQ